MPFILDFYDQIIEVKRMLKNDEKQAKLAEAMRANLAKRKQQMRARKTHDKQSEKNEETNKEGK